MKIIKKIKAYKSLRKDIAKAIGYCDLTTNFDEIDDSRGFKWSIKDTYLRVYNKQEDDFFEYKIMQHDDHEKTLYTGVIDNLIFIMCEDEAGIEGNNVVILRVKDELKY